MHRMAKAPTVESWLPTAIIIGGVLVVILGFYIQNQGLNSYDGGTGTALAGSAVAWIGAIIAIAGAVAQGVRLGMLSLREYDTE